MRLPQLGCVAVVGTENISKNGLSTRSQAAHAPAAPRSTASEELVMKSINAIRFLAIDGVEKANSGHPGLPMGCAPMTYVLFREFMRFNPKNPQWVNRDRFVLSAGHGSMLHYSMLHLCGYDSVQARRPAPSATPGANAAAAARRPRLEAGARAANRAPHDRSSRICSSSASGAARRPATRRTS